MYAKVWYPDCSSDSGSVFSGPGPPTGGTDLEADVMITWIRGIGSLLGLFALVAAAPGYAVAGPPVPNDAVVQACHAGTGPCAMLYETTENMSLKAL